MPKDIHIHTNKRIKRLSLRLDNAGNVHVNAPPRCSPKMIDRFVKLNASWIKRHRNALTQLQSSLGIQEKSLLLWGENYRCVHEPNRHDIFCDNATQTIAYKADLSDPLTRHVHLQPFARPFIASQINSISHAIGLPFNKLSIRNQKSRWGSCSAQKNISLNWRLIQLPPDVSDYIVIHELCHTVEMNHSARFWQHVATHCPDYKQHQQWLKTYGRIILA